MSVVVIIYDMRQQALNTLKTLSQHYQLGISQHDYEVIVVENVSPNTLQPADIESLPSNFSYYLRHEKGVSPASAINFGVAKAKAQYIGIIIDGARMLTPGVLMNAKAAWELSTDALTIIPAYHLGQKEQQHQDVELYNSEIEGKLLADAGWPDNGYSLFSISCLSAPNRHGFFHPFMECNCFFVRKSTFAEIGGADERFNLSGGGALNLYIYYKLAMHPTTRLILLPGEGCFHQVHGGVTTSAKSDRDAVLNQFKIQLEEILGHPFKAPRIEPFLLGKIPVQSFKWMEYSLEQARARVESLTRQGREYYEDASVKADN